MLCGLKRGISGALLLGSRGSSPRLGHGSSYVIFIACCVGSSLCDGLRVRFKGVLPGLCLIVCDLETSRVMLPTAEFGCFSPPPTPGNILHLYYKDELGKCRVGK
jgi:hypothetical protein